MICMHTTHTYTHTYIMDPSDFDGGGEVCRVRRRSYDDAHKGVHEI